jgi:methylenetetrahydrofolate dehydrogenase (NADP+)/methenyltetrahydrofolate cyclohydrolase
VNVAAVLIDGKQIAQRMLEDVKSRVGQLRARGKTVALRAILIGDDAAALSYARSQADRAKAVGIDYELVQVGATATFDEVRADIDRLNRDAAVSGVMMHLPTPGHLDSFALQQCIAAAKDVEGIGAANLGLLAMGRPALAPCTALAAFECLKSVCPDVAGKRVVVVGRSVIVGKPLAMMLVNADATVVQCHSKTRELEKRTREAEILVVAMGRAGFIGAGHVSPGAIVIDVGTNRVEAAGADGVVKARTVGDVKYDEVAAIAGAITPVPGGVGPITVAALLSNTVAACERGS